MADSPQAGEIRPGRSHVTEYSVATKIVVSLCLVVLLLPHKVSRHRPRSENDRQDSLRLQRERLVANLRHVCQTCSRSPLSVLQDVWVRLGSSDVHGVGVFALRDIPEVPEKVGVEASMMAVARGPIPSFLLVQDRARRVRPWSKRKLWRSLKKSSSLCIQARMRPLTLLSAVSLDD
eukprot:753293-Hanusia_phi.AAC.3